MSSEGPEASSDGASHCTFSVGKALTTASAAKPERTAKSEKRIVIELRIGKQEVSLSDCWTEAVDRTRTVFIPFIMTSTSMIDSDIHHLADLGSAPSN